MNALYLLKTARQTQAVQILLDLSYVLVTVDILEMEPFAKVIVEKTFLYHLV